ncbi:hypothetical protein B0A53_05269 [Rhodotorula sp. CCFEE 5036]|nr:hypothetical protein B0A53_05269 [Rhodotorula sp. CCFEE 5036]
MKARTSAVEAREGRTNSESSAAAYIAAQAAAEEAHEAEVVRSGQAKRPRVVPDPDAWRGEESRERMLKRILEDQYKPLRVKGYQKPIPQPAPLPSQAFETAEPTVISTPTRSTSSESPGPQNPWDVVFRPPEHYNPLPGYRATDPNGTGTISARKAAIAAARKDASLSSRPSAFKKQRLANAYERSLDYRGGVRRPSGSVRSGLGSGGGFDLMSGRGVSVPVHEQQSGQNAGGQAQDFQVWEGWLEEKIKQARKDGVFDKVQGRGKPIQRDHAESNPFIDRTEFLMNRILKTQEAAPPWIEMQKELDAALSAFRTELRSNWTRRAIRIRSTEGLTGAVVREVRDGWTDPEWIAREKGYHEVSLQALNEMTRKYNIIAPYNVRRPLLTVANELREAFSSCAPTIAAELQRRLDHGMGTQTRHGLVVNDPGDVRSVTADDMGGEQEADKKDTMWRAFRRLVVEVFTKDYSVFASLSAGLGTTPLDSVPPPRTRLVTRQGLPLSARHIAGMADRIKEVWTTNLEEEMSYLRAAIEKYPFVAMDTEFPGVVARPIGSFRGSSDYHYQTLRCNVDLLRIIQLGLTLCDENGELAPGVCTWQFNFQFSINDDMYAPESIELLTKSGINFKRHEEYGIPVEHFGELLISSGLVLLDDVQWISFHSGYDFGYLLKIVSCAPLPPTETEFFELLRIWFPCIWDIKYLMKSCKTLKGGLQEVADDLGVSRIGPQHQAGSDSLLTAATFFKMRDKFFENSIDKKFMGVLYGLNSGSAITNLTYPREFNGAVHYPVNVSTPIPAAAPLAAATSSAIAIMSPSPKQQPRP